MTIRLHSWKEHNPTRPHNLTHKTAGSSPTLPDGVAQKGKTDAHATPLYNNPAATVDGLHITGCHS